MYICYNYRIENGFTSNPNKTLIVLITLRVYGCIYGCMYIYMYMCSYRVENGFVEMLEDTPDEVLPCLSLEEHMGCGTTQRSIHCFLCVTSVFSLSIAYIYIYIERDYDDDDDDDDV